jgi:hypothetical protein
MGSEVGDHAIQGGAARRSAAVGLVEETSEPGDQPSEALFGRDQVVNEPHCVLPGEGGSAGAERHDRAP